MLDVIGVCADNLSNSDILDVCVGLVCVGIGVCIHLVCVGMGVCWD